MPDRVIKVAPQPRSFLPEKGVCPLDGTAAFWVVSRHIDEETGNLLVDFECDLGHTWTGGAFLLFRPGR